MTNALSIGSPHSMAGKWKLAICLNECMHKENYCPEHPIVSSIVGDTDGCFGPILVLGYDEFAFGSQIDATYL